MGNSTKSFNQNFLNEWVQIQKEQSLESDKIIWAKLNDRSIQMQEYSLNVTSKEQLQEEYRIHSLRQNHPQLVSSLHFKNQTQEQFCASSYKGKIYIERIPLTLQSITDIPFPDALHIYSQSLQGFHTLVNQVESGCFPISQQHIGINCESVCKVWMNSKFNRNYPSRNQKIIEERMVKNILDTIQENSDLGSLNGVPSPTQYIYSKAKVPSQVKFGEAINLLRNYANEYFGGVTPQKLSCVDKVGGAFLLARNWEGEKSQIGKQGLSSSQGQGRIFEAQAQAQTQAQFYQSNGALNVQSGSLKGVQNVQNQNYTTFRRQEPLQRSVPVVQPAMFTQEGSMGRTVPVEINITQVKPQIVIQGQQVSGAQFVNPALYQGSQVSQTVGRAAQNEVRGSQFLMGNSPRNEIRKNLIENRVEQVTSQKGIVFQSFSSPQPVYSSIAQQPISFNPQQPITFNQQQQPITFNQSPQPITFNQQPQPITLNQQPQQILFNQQPPQFSFSQQPITFSQPPPQQVARIGISQEQRVISTRKSTTFMNNSKSAVMQETILQRQQISRVQQQVLVGQIGMIKNSQLQKVNSKLVFIERVSPSKYTVGEEVRKPISNSNNYTQEPTATITQQYTDYSSSYYAFTSKLYDNQNESPSIKATSPTMSKVNATYNFQPISITRKESFGEKKTESPSLSKYSVKLDDGMSSADFLSSLMNTNYITSNKEKTYDYTAPTTNYSYLKDFNLNNYNTTTDYSTKAYDFGKKNDFLIEKEQTYKNREQPLSIMTREQPLSIMTREQPLSMTREQPLQQPLSYQIDYNQYTATITDPNNNQNDLIVVGSRINLTPIQSTQNNQFHQQQQPHYKMSYEYQEGKTPSGDLYYENQSLTLQGQNNQIYEENYQENYHGEQPVYQSVFDKYAQLSDNLTSANNLTQNQQYSRLGENVQTIYTLDNIDQPQQQSQYAQLPLSSMHMQQSTEEEYKVDFDPEILADLERLKANM